MLRHELLGFLTLELVLLWNRASLYLLNALAAFLCLFIQKLVDLPLLFLPGIGEALFHGPLSSALDIPSNKPQSSCHK
jgi:hypothetical protein